MGHAAFVQGEARGWPRPLIECLHDGSKPKAVQDLKPLLLALHRQGIDMPGPYFDTMVADYLLNPNRRAHTLEAIAMDLLSYQLGAGERATMQARARNPCSMWMRIWFVEPARRPP
jgi:DNA polymerase-1